MSNEEGKRLYEDKIISDNIEDLITVKGGICLLSIGDTGTGKTHSLRWLFKECLWEQYDYGIVISGTCKVNNDYDYIPQKYQYDYLCTDVIEKIVESQTKLKIKEKRANGKPCPKVFIIIDDSIGLFDSHNKEGKIFDQVTRFRHLNISTFFLIQHCKYLSPAIRQSARIVLVTLISDKNIDATYELCSRGFGNKKNFLQFVNAKCTDYNIVMFDKSNPYADKYIKILRAPRDIEPFLLKY